jgi:hypothetical protein
VTPTPAFAGWFFAPRLHRWLSEPQHALRIEFLRIFSPLAILGFMSSRVAYADEWLGNAGFRVPDLGVADYRQPLYLPNLPAWAAWSIAIVLVVSGLMMALGFRPRRAAVAFALAATYVALSDRLAAFSVSKMAPMVGITIALLPCGRFLSIDSWLRRRRGDRTKPPVWVPSGSIRFVQVLLPTIYSASGIAKCRGDWLRQSHVLWTHLHDSYQTFVTVALANLLPPFAWTALQGVTLLFEVGAPVWFGVKRLQPIGLVMGVGMHTMIGLMFGPVRYFAMLMSSLLITAYLPDRFYERAARRLL